MSTSTINTNIVCVCVCVQTKLCSFLHREKRTHTYIHKYARMHACMYACTIIFASVSLTIPHIVVIIVIVIEIDTNITYFYFNEIAVLTHRLTLDTVYVRYTLDRHYRCVWELCIECVVVIIVVVVGFLLRLLACLPAFACLPLARSYY